MPDFAPLVRGWGGVTLAYRKRMVDAPAYRLNHEEVIKALEEGISFAENLNPVEAVPDAQGHVQAVIFDREQGQVELPARAVLVAAGTTPNITYEKERQGSFALDAKKKFFQGHRPVRSGAAGAAGAGSGAGWDLVPDDTGFFTSCNDGGRLVSYYGDNHPAYAGNVVKAMASAKDGYPHVTALFAEELAALDPAAQASRDAAWHTLAARLDADLVGHVHEVRRLTDTIVEVIVHAPAAARRFEPGQFYRLQNFETLARQVDLDGRTTPLLMEGIALTGAWVDREKGLLSLIALELGVSSRLVAYLEAGEPVVVMGPTGAPTDIPTGEAVLLAGGGLGNAVLFSIAKALRSNGNRVIYFAGYKKGEDMFKREEIEEATDQVIWSTDIGVEITPGRPQDAHFRGNIVQSMVAYATGQFGTPLVPLSTVDRIIAIGSDRMMAAVKAVRSRGPVSPASAYEPATDAAAILSSPSGSVVIVRSGNRRVMRPASKAR